MKAVTNLVILQLLLQLNISKTDKSNIHGIDFYYSGLHFPRIVESTCFCYDLLSSNKLDQLDDYLNMIDNLLDQFDMMINKPK
jgi:hypothetical protein